MIANFSSSKGLLRSNTPPFPPAFAVGLNMYSSLVLRCSDDNAFASFFELLFLWRLKRNEKIILWTLPEQTRGRRGWCRGRGRGWRRDTSSDDGCGCRERKHSRCLSWSKKKKKKKKKNYDDVVLFFFWHGFSNNEMFRFVWRDDVISLFSLLKCSFVFWLFFDSFLEKGKKKSKRSCGRQFFLLSRNVQGWGKKRKIKGEEEEISFLKSQRKKSIPREPRASLFVAHLLAQKSKCLKRLAHPEC